MDNLAVKTHLLQQEQAKKEAEKQFQEVKPRFKEIIFPDASELRPSVYEDLGTDYFLNRLLGYKDLTNADIGTLREFVKFLKQKLDWKK